MIISLEGITKFYGSGAGKQQVLFEIDLDIERSALVSIVGTSGSGKSTLLNIIGGLDRDFEGKVTVDGTCYKGLSDKRLSVLRNKTIGFIFQSFNLLDHLTCWENVALPAFFDQKPSGNAKQKAVEVLKRLGLENKVDVTPGNLSGGQKQRVAIARALYNKPKLLLCDEPTGNLDTKTGAQIIELFKELNAKDGITLILVTHEDRLSRVAQRVLRLEDGRIVDEIVRADGGESGQKKSDPEDMDNEKKPDSKPSIPEKDDKTVSENPDTETTDKKNREEQE